jgi:hypothetical protein
VSEMTLVDAFHAAAPPIGEPAVDAVRCAAMAVLYEALQALAGRDPALEDAPGVVLGRLVSAGPRAVGQYDTDDKVEFYLRRALRNFRIAGGRGRARHVELDEGRPAGLVGGFQSAEWDPTEISDARRELVRAFDRLFGEILPGCREGTVEAVSVRRRVAEGRATFDDGVREQLGDVTKKTRDAFYQRQTRAMRELTHAVGAYVAGRALPAWESTALRVALEYLKDAEAAWLLGGGA